MGEIRKLTSGPRHHFFGYYGINVWDPTARLHLALETDFHRRPPTPSDEAKVGLVDRDTGHFTPVSKTRAFNLQQGSMMHWIDAGRGAELTHNDWRDGKTVSRAIRLEDRAERTIDAAIAAVSPDGKTAMGLNYGRMYHCRSVVGYANDTDPETLPLAPEDDGLYRINLASGSAGLVLSIAEVLGAAHADADLSGRGWFNHVMFNTDGSRVLFFCRFQQGGGHRSSLWTVRPDGSDLRMQIGFDHWISHFAWQDPDTILISTDLRGKRQFFLGHDGGDDFAPFGEGILPRDGHACFSPDRRWIVCDRATDVDPDHPEHSTEVLLYCPEENERVSLGLFEFDAIFRGDIRCDLHPRWAPDGKALTIDAVPDGDRQIYLIDVSQVVG